MENKAHALATGLFILLLGAALVAVIAWFQGDHSEHVGYTVVSKTGVPGLNIKASVKLHGVEIGKVEAIAFDTQVPGQILVSIQVAKSAPLTASTVAQLGYQGITGLSFIDLSDGPTPAAAASSLPEGARIELRPSVLDQLSTGGPRLLAAVNEAALRLNTLLSDTNQQQLSRALGNLGEASAGVAQLTQSLRPAVAALQPLARQGDTLLQGASASLLKFDTLAAESTLLARELQQRAKALDQLGLAAAQLQATTQRLELALVGANNPRTAPLLDDISQAARAVEHAADDLNEHPQSLVFGRANRPPGPGETGFVLRKGP
ncbi:MlaD family protein [soil metagenome]